MECFFIEPNCIFKSYLKVSSETQRLFVLEVSGVVFRNQYIFVLPEEI